MQVRAEKRIDIFALFVHEHPVQDMVLAFGDHALGEAINKRLDSLAPSNYVFVRVVPTTNRWRLEWSEFGKKRTSKL